MPIQFKDEDWAVIRQLISAAGGFPTGYTRDQLEREAYRVFDRQVQRDASKDTLLKVAKAARALEAALSDWVVQTEDSSRLDPDYREIPGPIRASGERDLATRVSRYADYAEYVLDKEYDAYSEERRGPGAPTKDLFRSWCYGVIITLADTGVALADERDRTPAALTDVVLFLAGLLPKSDALPHGDLRRAVTRILTGVRLSIESEREERKRLAWALDAILHAP